jgi:putative cell wall-binding protein
MKKTLLLLFFFIVVIYSLPAQILADSITTTKALVNHSEVEALRISREVTYQDIKQNNQWQPYDSTYTTTEDLAVWLRFNLENTTEDTINTYIYTKDQYIDIYIISELGTEHLKNGHLVSLSDRDNKTESYFTEIVLQPSQTSVCFIKLANDYTSQIQILLFFIQGLTI